MQPSSVELEREVRERTEALEAAYRQLAKQENDLRSLQARYQDVVQQLDVARRRAESLIELSNRFGLR